jgi:hypothetical protein
MAECEDCETQKHGKPLTREEMLKAIETYNRDAHEKTKGYVR